ncbi:MAG TPA: hypothetical protein VFO37_11675 [Chitinophagaceae bacterium]|nr:hypothetical protein [Chitinophagaceae bacterium]
MGRSAMMASEYLLIDILQIRAVDASAIAGRATKQTEKKKI